VTRSGLADSPFFAPVGPVSESTPPATKPPGDATAAPRKVGPRAGRQSIKDEPLQASKLAGIQTGVDAGLVELIRKAVKEIGKESTTYRFTPEEKKALLELTFTYKVQGYKTSENELARVAVNFLLEDHRQNGRSSILEKVLQALDK